MSNNPGDPGVQERIDLVGELKAIRLAFSRTLPRAVVELNAGVAEGFEMVSALIANHTSTLSTLKGRQAVASAAQATSLIILVLWLLTLAVRAAVRCITEKQEAKQEELVEMMERSLNERRSKKKAAARPSPADK